METKKDAVEIKELVIDKDDSIDIEGNAAIYITIKWP